MKVCDNFFIGKYFCICCLGDNMFLCCLSGEMILRFLCSVILPSEVMCISCLGDVMFPGYLCDVISPGYFGSVMLPGYLGDVMFLCCLYSAILLNGFDDVSCLGDVLLLGFLNGQMFIGGHGVYWVVFEAYCYLDFLVM